MRTENTTVREDTPTAALLSEGATPAVDTLVAEVTCKALIDDNLVVDGLLFATPGDRCRYLGTSHREKPRWLEENKGRYRYLPDVLQEAAHLGRPDNVEAATTRPNCEPSSRISLVGTPPEGCSPPDQPTSLSEPLNENLPNRSTQAELLPRAKATATETAEPKTETNPLGTPGHQRGHSRRRKNPKLPPRIAKSARKLSPALMRIVLDYLREYPVQYCAARAAGIHRKTLARWIKRSKAGDDIYVIEWQDLTCRFHEHCEAAIEEAKEAVEVVAWKLAMGVPYESDPDLLNVGCGPKVYLRRPNGKMIRVLLERERPEEYGKNRKIDTPQTGGVLVIGSPAEKPKHNTAASVKARQWKALSRKVREAKP